MCIYISRYSITDGTVSVPICVCMNVGAEPVWSLCFGARHIYYSTGPKYSYIRTTVCILDMK